ncbi:Predicted flavoprotein CzcO associated with the cation diffusion facilitator CzcD [Actinokineospora alba]|uniref:FAD-containing monooxygenase EthA n=1 Tax=Actinokineospora alba TaxID=504798 RepID=A0A1H0EPX6_9PSEU|nr:NAD(P)/FAD-dependent oxidoreductase [Actinokineospora alba]TDP69178.1 cation diffusion facilitator CzcD-associated flavoprotein CzcO [Actinokineospora alba]SDI22648.1 Predicted flavoprotein CzcO associated with the cation diffusion facilitator CzcD [Actinokineospora alba]SDN84517.1 Predicted flavoprotein CzcO associated with the cation diffusion facilitator CzcD [Actinokineospora alba]
MTDQPQHVNVVIVGAGLSGIGAACHLQAELPAKTYTILEARDSIGGTWDLFRYPGIRSDSDMFTLGYRFKPWTEQKAIADGHHILSYVKETAREYGVERHIRFGYRVVSAEWSSTHARWTVRALRGDTGDAMELTCDFLLSATGYYRYDEGYLPEFAGTERFGGTIVHPQHWPEDLDYADKRVVVIGSGATAVTLVPSMAPDAAHVTMLQRSPSYIVTIPAKDAIGNALRKVLPGKLAYAITRWKNVLIATGFYQLSRRRPGLVKKLLRKALQRQLPADYDIDTHFKPSYNPWDQRVCLVPNGDLFRSIRRGQVSIVTDRIETFTETGLRLASGATLDADIIITATGLNLLAFGGMELVVDGNSVKLPETMAYKGMMLSGVPNFGYIVGYTNASWTLKADIACEYICRLLKHMVDNGYDSCVPERDPAVAEEPFMDFSAGYVQRSIGNFPKQGEKAPWRLRMNYLRDVFTLRHSPIADGAMRFGRLRV